MWTNNKHSLNNKQISNKQKDKPVVVDVGLVKVPLVVVGGAQVAVGPRLLDLEITKINNKQTRNKQ